VLLLGPEIWRDYLQFATIMRQTILEQGDGGWHRLVSGLRVRAPCSERMCCRPMWRRPPWDWSQRESSRSHGFAMLRRRSDMRLLVLGAFLATPYLLDYDWWWARSWRVWMTRPENVVHHSERTVLITVGLVLIAPLFTALLTNTTGFALGPLFVIPAFVLAARAALANRDPVHASAH
jgi:hypothetical protein